MTNDYQRALKAYKMYVALKTHFHTWKYDFLNKGGRTKASWGSFDKRRDKPFFYTLADHPDMYAYIISNLAYDDFWVGDLVMNKRAEENYAKFRRIRESLTYTLEQDMKKLLPGGPEPNIIVTDKHPYLLQLYLQDEITLETLCILAHLTKAVSLWNSKLEHEVIWRNLKKRVIKYNRFIRYTPGIKRVVYEWMNNNTDNTKIQANTINIENTEKYVNVI